jgi:hypothetical protein
MQHGKGWAVYIYNTYSNAHGYIYIIIYMYNYIYIYRWPWPLVGWLVVAASIQGFHIALVFLEESTRLIWACLHMEFRVSNLEMTPFCKMIHVHILTIV